jgi:hypothetical protein
MLKLLTRVRSLSEEENSQRRLDRSFSRFEPRFEPNDLPNDEEIKKDEQDSPEDDIPRGWGQLRDGRGYHSVPIKKLQNKDKKQE